MAHYSTRDVLDDLIEKRLIVPDGQMRRNRKGDLEPVYVVRSPAGVPTLFCRTIPICCRLKPPGSTTGRYRIRAHCNVSWP